MSLAISYCTQKGHLVFFWVLLVFCLTIGCTSEQTVYFKEGRKKVNGTELYYKILGSGDPIVVLHGGPGFEHTYLLPQMERLANNYKLIFYDQRATGGSEADVDSSSMTLEMFVEDLEELRKAFGLNKMNLMGHSWGGMLALFYSIKYPDNINSLMLINSGGARSGFWDDLYANIDRNRSTEDSLAMANIRASNGFKDSEIAAWEEFYDLFFRPFFFNKNHSDSLNMKFTATTVKNMSLISASSLNRELRSYDILDKLSIIKSPTLIVHGKSDVIPFEYAQEIHKHIADSRLFILEQCGHFSYIEKPDKFSELIHNFMDQVVGN